MRLFYIFIFALVCGFVFSNAFCKEELAGKNLFYTLKSKYGSCNTCHTGGGSAGRWNFGTKKIDFEEGRKIPSLKGVGKRKNPDQIERSINLMQKLFGFKLTKLQMEQLVEYVGTL